MFSPDSVPLFHHFYLDIKFKLFISIPLFNILYCSHKTISNTPFSFPQFGFNSNHFTSFIFNFIHFARSSLVYDPFLNQLLFSSELHLIFTASLKFVSCSLWLQFATFPLSIYISPSYFAAAKFFSLTDFFHHFTIVSSHIFH